MYCHKTHTSRNSSRRCHESKNNGFSLIEIVVGTALSAIAIYSAQDFMFTFKETKSQLNEKSEEDIKSVHHKFFSTKFISILDDANVSVNYFVLPIKLPASEKDHCASVAGGCFMTLDQNSQISGLDKSIVKTKSGENVSGLNFFNDQKNTVELKEFAHIKNHHLLTLRPAYYKKYVRRSKDKRYFIGWSLVDESTPPFYVMTRTTSKFYFNTGLVLGSQPDAAHSIVKGSVIAKPYNFNGKNQELSFNYKKMHYLFYESYYPHIYWMSYVHNINHCHDKTSKDEMKFTPDCLKYCAEISGIGDLTSEMLSQGLVKTTCNPRHQFLLNLKGGSSSLNTDFFTTPSQAGLDPIDLWLGQGPTNFFPYFPHKTLSLVRKTSSGKSAMRHMNTHPLNPVYLMNEFAAQEGDRNSSHPSRGISAVPVIFHKFMFSQTKQDGTKDLVMTSDVRQRANKPPQVVIRSLLPKARVVFARQLGTMRIYAFIFDNDKKEDADEAKNTQQTP